MQTRPVQTSSQRPDDGPTASLPVHQATALTEGGSLALIQLDDQYYTLRITRAGKLILTK